MAEFLSGYFSTHDRQEKTQVACNSALTQSSTFAGREADLASLNGALIESWASHYVKNIIRLLRYEERWSRSDSSVHTGVLKGLLSESQFWRVKLSLDAQTVTA
jgi:hypothetical protein